MAEYLRQIPREMGISTAEALVGLPLLGVSVGAFLVIETGKEVLLTWREVLKTAGISIGASLLEAKTGDRTIHDETLDVIEHPSKAFDEMMSVLVRDGEGPY